MRSASLVTRHTWLFAAALFAAATLLYTRHNTFPVFYHPDEPRKAEQVITGQRDFRHPLLLLTAADLAARLLRAERSAQAVVVAGRWCSAIFAAAAVAVLALLAYRQRGIAAMVTVGALVLLHPQLFELAHYMKEDTALLFGLALFLLALDAFGTMPTHGTAFFLGAAAGVAGSAKYVGFILGLLAMIVITGGAGRTGDRIRAAGVCLLGMLLLVSTINLPGIVDPASWVRGFSKEMAVFESGAYGVRKPASWNVFGTLLDHVSLAGWLFGACYAVGFLTSPRRKSAADWTILLLPYIYTAALAATGKDSGRYFLPAVALLNYQCGIGIINAAERISAWAATRTPRWRSVAVAGCLALTLTPAIASLTNAYAHFTSDTRRELIEYVARALPESAVIVAEHRTGLGSIEGHEQFGSRRVTTMPFASDGGSLEELRANGVTHVAVAQQNYQRFTARDMLHAADSREQSLQRRTFYERLFAEGTLLFEAKQKKVVMLNPGLRLYEIAAIRPTALVR